MGEQQATTSKQEEFSNACPHPEAVGNRWGDPISTERQTQLQGYLDRWMAETDHSERKGPFVGIRLSGADVSWLADQSIGRGFSGAVPNLHLEGARLREAHLEGANLSEAHLEGANLSEAHLEGADFFEAHLAGANLGIAYMAGASLSRAYLKEADLSIAQLEGATLIEANLEGADLSYANLEGATLRDAQLTQADLSNANLAHANLSGALLARANLNSAQLERADLRRSTFDKASRLNGAVFTGASFDQVSFDNTNLTTVDWGQVTTLGDEMVARKTKDSEGKTKSHAIRLDEFKAAVRANRVLAVVLRAQGLNEDADRFAYKAQTLQRQVLRRQRRYGAAFGSWFLDTIAGYGYRPSRSVYTYAIVVLGFAAAYFALTNFDITPFLPAHSSPLPWYEAFVLSISSFHGRGLFPTGLSLGDPIAILAAFEAIIGLLIEITFIATFTQRFFAR